MSEPKFTPGPWAYEMSDNYARIYLHNHLDKKNIYGKDSLCGYCGEANAALIAAAPELYRELEELASLVQNSDSTYWEGVNPDEVVADARAALAKARGKSEQT